MGERFSAIFGADVRGGRPSIAAEKLVRVMLLQALFDIPSERQLVEQIHNNPLRAAQQRDQPTADRKRSITRVLEAAPPS